MVPQRMHTKAIEELICRKLLGFLWELSGPPQSNNWWFLEEPLNLHRAVQFSRHVTKRLIKIWENILQYDCIQVFNVLPWGLRRRCVFPCPVIKKEQVITWRHHRLYTKWEKGRDQILPVQWKIGSSSKCDSRRGRPRHTCRWTNYLFTNA